MARIILNKIKISKKVNESLKKPRFEKFAYNAANFRFNVGVVETLKEFDNHVVTKELREGAKATTSVLSYGNLPAFLGLPDSESSVADVRDYLKNRFNLDDKAKFSQTNKSVVYQFRVSAPSLQEIYDAFPAPEKKYNKSWISVIENGMGNFSYFVFRLLGIPGSRSGTGLQRETKRKWLKVPDSNPKVNWIKDVLNSFRARFSK